MIRHIQNRASYRESHFPGTSNASVASRDRGSLLKPKVEARTNGAETRG